MINLTQQEANTLIALEKHRMDETRYSFPMFGQSLKMPLQSPDRRESFILDFRTSRIDLLKATMQNRGRHVIVLVRLDLGCAPHRNPDDEEIMAPHIHVYREGYGDRWAFPAPNDLFRDLSNLGVTLDDFMAYCNVTRPPHIDRGLFI